MNYFINLLVAFTLTSGLYSINLTKCDGSSVSLGQYSGKKILFVNIATTSPHKTQLVKLDQLRQLHGDSLVIVIVPSNSFGNEPKTNIELQSYFRDSIPMQCVVSEKLSVAGANKSALYQWLTEKEKNGVFSNAAGGDFYKFLVNESGHLVGVFSSVVDPLSDELRSAISSY